MKPSIIWLLIIFMILSSSSIINAAEKKIIKGRLLLDDGKTIHFECLGSAHNGEARCTRRHTISGKIDGISTTYNFADFKEIYLVKFQTYRSH